MFRDHLAGWLLAAAVPSAALAPAPTEIIRGTVATETGAPLPDAAIVATRAPDRAMFTARSGESLVTG